MIPQSAAVTVDADAHTRAMTDSADILVPSIPWYQPPLERPSEPSGAPFLFLLLHLTPALMDDEGKEGVIAERLSLSDSRVLSFGQERKKEGRANAEYRKTGQELLGGFSESDKERHLYIIRCDRCSTIIDLEDDYGKARETEKNEIGTRGAKVLTRISRARSDSVEHVDRHARSRDRA